METALKKISILDVKLPPEKFFVAINFFILFALIDFSYIDFIVKEFDYFGYYYEFSLGRAVTSVGLLILFVLFYLITPMTEFMFLINTLTYILFLIPALVLYKDLPSYTSDILFFTVLYTLLLLFIGSSFKIKGLEKQVYKLNLKWILIFILIVSVPIFMKYKLNFNVKLESLTSFFTTDVETRRAAFQNISGIYFYLYVWITKVFVPLMIVHSIYEKKFLYAIIGIALMIYYYLIFTHKSIFFSALIIAFFAFYRNLKKTTVWLILLLNLSIVFSILLRYKFDFFLFESLIVRRVLITPQFLNIAYFDFFKNNHLYLSYSILSAFFEYPYTKNPAIVVGEYYFGREMMSANNGFISQGYADFGYIGILIYTLIVVGIWVYFNSLSLSPIYTGVFILFYFTIASSFITTVLLTHGGLILMVILPLFGYRYKQPKLM